MSGHCASDLVRRALSVGEVAILVDATRSRGIMFALAHLIDADGVNLMARHARGLICFAVDADQAFHLGLETGRRASSPRSFLPSVEARSGVSTGISAADRAATLRVAGASTSASCDLVTPGHVIPSLARWPCPFDARLDEVALAWARAVAPGSLAAWCDILDEDGELASAAYCFALAASLRLTVEAWRDGADRNPFADLISPEGLMCAA